MSIIAILAMVGISIAGKVIYDRFNEKVFTKHKDYVDSWGNTHRFYAVEYVDAARLGSVETVLLTAVIPLQRYANCIAILRTKNARSV